MLIGLNGISGSGKDTVADIYESYGYIRLSFAEHLKKVCCIVFGWDENDITGKNQTSRQWREEVDHWWSFRLGRQITPRQILQEIGTNVFRDHFDENIWLYSISRKIEKYLIEDKNVIITDVRFANESDMIKCYNGIIIHIDRPNDKEWLNDAKIMNYNDFKQKWKNVHESDYFSVNIEYDKIILNQGSIDDLKSKILNDL
jgi:hypothetical protein